jgi:hypothetical protein
MVKKPLLIWFDSNGNMLDQAYNNSPYYTNYQRYVSEEAKDFKDRMEVIKIKEYRRKNTRVLLKSTSTGREYTMYVDDFNEALANKRVIDLHLEGIFRFVKRGSGQAVQLFLFDNP